MPLRFRALPSPCACPRLHRTCPHLAVPPTSPFPSPPPTSRWPPPLPCRSSSRLPPSSSPFTCYRLRAVRRPRSTSSRTPATSSLARCSCLCRKRPLAHTWAPRQYYCAAPTSARSWHAHCANVSSRTHPLPASTATAWDRPVGGPRSGSVRTTRYSPWRCSSRSSSGTSAASEAWSVAPCMRVRNGHAVRKAAAGGRQGLASQWRGSVPVCPRPWSEARSQRGRRGRAWPALDCVAHTRQNPRPFNDLRPELGAGRWHSEGGLVAVSSIGCSGSSTATASEGVGGAVGGGKAQPRPRDPTERRPVRELDVPLSASGQTVRTPGGGSPGVRLELKHDVRFHADGEQQGRRSQWREWRPSARCRSPKWAAAALAARRPGRHLPQALVRTDCGRHGAHHRMRGTAARHPREGAQLPRRASEGRDRPSSSRA